MNVTIERAFDNDETTEIDNKYMNILMVHIDYYNIASNAMYKTIRAVVSSHNWLLAVNLESINLNCYC